MFLWCSFSSTAVSNTKIMGSIPKKNRYSLNIYIDIYIFGDIQCTPCTVPDVQTEFVTMENCGSHTFIVAKLISLISPKMSWKYLCLHILKVRSEFPGMILKFRMFWKQAQTTWILFCPHRIQIQNTPLSQFHCFSLWEKYHCFLHLHN